jgi:hypothetical protein
MAWGLNRTAHTEWIELGNDLINVCSGGDWSPILTVAPDCHDRPVCSDLAHPPPLYFDGTVANGRTRARGGEGGVLRSVDLAVDVRPKPKLLIWKLK